MTALTVPADIDTSLARRPSLSALLDAAKRHLDEARTYEQVKKVRAEARALEAFAKAVGAGREAQRLCAEYVLRADQRLGQELRKIEKAKRRRRPAWKKAVARCDRFACVAEALRSGDYQVAIIARASARRGSCKSFGGIHRYGTRDLDRWRAEAN